MGYSEDLAVQSTESSARPLKRAGLGARKFGQNAFRFDRILLFETAVMHIAGPTHRRLLAPTGTLEVLFEDKQLFNIFPTGPWSHHWTAILGSLVLYPTTERSDSGKV